MKIQNEILQQAKALNKDARKKIISSFREGEIHQHLKELFYRMEPNYLIEITHGPRELGKDLVIVKKDKLDMDVIGIVVKKGNLRGKTLGDIDEIKEKVKNCFSYKSKKRLNSIKSQVEQAQKHPAQLKAYFKELPISKVTIVLVGELSNTARDRLNELEGNINIVDINWLIDNFTNYYPEIFFEGEVIDFIQKKILELEAKHWLANKGINLSQYFVEPKVANIENPLKFDEDKLAVMFKKRNFPFSQLKSIITKTKRILLIGDPGVGKSGALDKLAIDMFKEASSKMLKGISGKKEIDIPILISAKEILDIDNHKTIIDKYIIDPNIAERFNIQVLMVDALDEVATNRSMEIIKKAEKFSNELHCSLVITSRKIDIIKNTPIGFEKYELLPFEYDQAIKLCKRLISRKEMLEPLKEGLQKIRFHISLIPLSLMLLIQLVEQNKEIPSSITELYNTFHDLMLGKWDMQKGIQVIFDFHIKKCFLGELAFEKFLKHQRLEITAEDFNKFINYYSERQNLDKKKLSIFNMEIERAGILDIGEKISFRHRSFLDFFAAFHLYNIHAEFKNLDDFIVQVYFDDMWEDTAFFYIGLRKNISEEIINKIFGFEKEELSTIVDKFLVGRLLQAGWYTQSKIKYDALKKAIGYAPIIRKNILKISQVSSDKFPEIFADFLIWMLSDFSFKSGVLLKENKKLFDAILTQLSEENLTQLFSILWSIHKLINPSELKERIDNFLGALQNISNLEEQARSLLLLILIEKENKTMNKTIKKQLKKLQKRFPDIFKKLLPERKKGFRLKQ